MTDERERDARKDWNLNDTVTDRGTTHQAGTATEATGTDRTGIATDATGTLTDRTLTDAPFASADATLTDAAFASADATLTDAPLASADATLTDAPLASADATLTDTPFASADVTLTDATLTDAARRSSTIPAPVPIPAGTPDAETYAKDTLLLDTYQVQSAPIQGGMGVVYRVHHTGWNTDLALKRSKQSYFRTEKQKTDFIGECERWINLGLHPNIVSCYYVRELDGIPSVFSEWMGGGSLSDQIKSGKLYQGAESQVKERLLDVAIQFARGLLYSHQNHLIHQDVKPGNLMLTKDYEAKVTDFGISGGGEGKDAQGWSGACTREYASAEQQHKGPFTLKTDMYSWAVSVLMMYCGSRPWQNGIDAGLDFDKHAQSVKVPLSGGLKALLKSCLEQDVAARPESFVPVIEALLAEYQAQTGQAYPRKQPKAAPDSADSLNNRALSYLDLGMPEEAEQLWDAAVKADPGNVVAQYNQGLFNMRREGKNDTNSLLKVMLPLIKICEGLPNAQGQYLLGLLELEAYSYAEAYFQEAQRLAADDPELCARSRRMGELAHRACVTLPAELRKWLTFDVSEDGKRCAVGTSHDLNADDIEDMLLLFDMESRELIARQVLEYHAEGMAFAGTRLYVRQTGGALLAWDAHTLAPLPAGEEDEIPEAVYESPLELYDGRRIIKLARPIHAYRGGPGGSGVRPGQTARELVDTATGCSLLNNHVCDVGNLDSRGIYLHIIPTYGPHAPQDSITLYDTRVYGQPAAYVLSQIATTAETLSKADRLASLMVTAQTACDQGDDSAALTALDEAYELWEGSPPEAWETLNNRIGASCKRINLRGTRLGGMRGRAEPLKGMVGAYPGGNVEITTLAGGAAEVVVRDDDGRVLAQGKDAAGLLHGNDCCAYDPASKTLYSAGASGQLNALSMRDGACTLLRSARLGPPLPKNEKEAASLRPFFRFQNTQADYALRPLEMILNGDGTALLLKAFVCNPYGEEDEYSNAFRLSLIPAATLTTLRSAFYPEDYMDRDVGESNGSPFRGACFSPDGHALLLAADSGAMLWFTPDFASCQTLDFAAQTPGRFRADGNSYPDDNESREVILDWKYAALPPEEAARVAQAAPPSPAPVSDAPVTVTGRSLARFELPEGTVRLLHDLAGNGSLAVAMTYGNRVTVIDTADGSARDLAEARDNAYYGLLLTLSQDQKQVYGIHKAIPGLYRWNVLNSADKAFQQGGYRAAVTALCPGAGSGNRVYAGMINGTLCVFAADTLMPDGVFPLFQSPVTALCLSPDHKRLYCAGERGELAVWDVSGQKTLWELDGRQPRTGMTALAVSPDGRFLAAVERDIAGLTRRESLQKTPGATLSPDRLSLFGEAQGGRVLLWALETGALLWAGAYQKRGYESVRFTADGRHLAACYESGATLWNTESGAVAREFPFDDVRDCPEEEWSRIRSGRLVAFDDRDAALIVVTAPEVSILRYQLQWNSPAAAMTAGRVGQRDGVRYWTEPSLTNPPAANMAETSTAPAKAQPARPGATVPAGRGIPSTGTTRQTTPPGNPRPVTPSQPAPMAKPAVPAPAKATPSVAKPASAPMAKPAAPAKATPSTPKPASAPMAKPVAPASAKPKSFLERLFGKGKK